MIRINIIAVRVVVRSFAHSFWLDRMWLDIVFGCICVVYDGGYRFCIESLSLIVLLVLLICLAFYILYEIQSYEYLE
jgi:hypothetical protein